jgi:hypothetical protein
LLETPVFFLLGTPVLSGQRTRETSTDWVLYEKEKVRFIVLEDVEGERVTIGVEAPTAGFEEFLPEAQEVVDTVEWEGT